MFMDISLLIKNLADFLPGWNKWVLLAALAFIAFYYYYRNRLKKANTAKINSTLRNNFANSPKIVTMKSILPSNPNLIGRESLIKELRNCIEKRSGAILLRGNRGIGVSEVCRTLFYHYSDERNSLIKYTGWLNFDKDLSSTFRAGFVSLQNNIGGDANDLLDQTIAYINRMGPDFLLFIDNIPQLTSKDCQILKKLTCKIILSVYSDVPAEFEEEIAVCKLMPQELTELYARYCPNAVQPKEALDEIIAKAGGNTLTIQLLAKNQQTAQLSSGALLKKMHETEFDLSKSKASADDGDEQLIVDNLCRLLSIFSFTNEELQLIKQYSILGSEPLGKNYFLKWLAQQHKAEMIDNVVARGWISKYKNYYYMHPLIVKVIRQFYPTTIEECDFLIDTLTEYLTISENETYINKLDILPFGVSLLSYFSDDNPQLIYLAKAIAKIYSEQGAYTEALDFFKTALYISLNSLGENDLYTAKLYSDMGLVYKFLSEYDKAMEFYNTALKIIVSELGPESGEAADLYNNIGLVYHEEGEYDYALNHYEKALAIKEKGKIRNNLEKSAIFNNMGLVYYNQGNYDKALKYFVRAGIISEKVRGKAHLDVTAVHNNIAAVYKDKGNYPKAKQIYTQVLSIRVRELGQYHPLTAASYNNLGIIYQEQKEYEQALEYYQIALDIKQNVLGLEHPSTATTCNNIGNVYREKKELEKALSFYEQALKIRKNKLGANHPSTATSYDNIGMIYQEEQEFEKAMNFYDLSLSIREEQLGKYHAATANTYQHIAQVYQSMGNIEQAFTWFEKALIAIVASFGVEHKSFIIIRDRIKNIFDQIDTNENFETWLNKLLAKHMKKGNRMLFLAK
ncbi:MAG: ATP-binding protein [Syntrophomonadaceae bacterium]|jgi:tetratricopeptide (TPR) repeat protein|nr:ATP-binding protein [Syntrophomonadaceae bacterium]